MSTCSWTKCWCSLWRWQGTAPGAVPGAQGAACWSGAAQGGDGNLVCLLLRRQGRAVGQLCAIPSTRSMGCSAVGRLRSRTVSSTSAQPPAASIMRPLGFGKRSGPSDSAPSRSAKRRGGCRRQGDQLVKSADTTVKSQRNIPVCLHILAYVIIFVYHHH
jgi:hypothetical protein